VTLEAFHEVDAVPRGQSCNDVLMSRDGGRVKSVDEVVAG
jgi:hypothetical protein